MTAHCKATVIYHGNCPDGWTSGWIMRRWLEARDVTDIQMFAGSYGEAPPDVIDRDVFILDFSYRDDSFIDLVNSCRSLTMLDHHKTTYDMFHDQSHVMQLFPSLPFTLIVFQTLVQRLRNRYPTKGEYNVVIDMSHSGAKLTEMFSGERYPFVDYVEDRDLWANKLENTEEICSAMYSYEFTDENWDYIASKSLASLAVEGVPIVRYRKKMIAAQVALAQEFDFEGYKILAAPSPYSIASDVAGELAKMSASGIGMYWQDYPDGQRSFGLRSRGNDAPDVATLAERFKGGGHRNASGFKLPYTMEAPVSEAFSTALSGFSTELIVDP